MATNYVQEGKVIDVLLTADVVSGGVVILDNKVGIAQSDGLTGATIPVYVEDVHLVPLKSGGSALAVGAPVGWDVAAGAVAGVVSVVPGDINNIGFVAANDCTGAESHVEVKLTPGTGVIV